VQALKHASDWTIDFLFGCEDSETGLFRTQHVDGIMGMSAADDTLPHQLVTQQVTDTRVFSLCFSIGGGILTLGGVDPLLHRPGEEVKYAKLIKGKGWFTVKFLDLLMRPAQKPKIRSLLAQSQSDQNPSSISIGVSVEVLNGPSQKGVIVDSGTTDTYLPQAAKRQFEDLFKKISGIPYSNNNIALKKSQIESLPTMIMKLEGLDGQGPVEIEMPPSSYMENLGGGKYAFRIYLTEASGAVLGANFMNDQNVIFDIDQRKVGFARSSCRYDEAVKDASSSGKHRVRLGGSTGSTSAGASGSGSGKKTSADSAKDKGKGKDRDKETERNKERYMQQLLRGGRRDSRTRRERWK
jgi:Eukaryotic aspartyl protease